MLISIRCKKYGGSTKYGVLVAEQHKEHATVWDLDHDGEQATDFLLLKSGSCNHSQAIMMMGWGDLRLGRRRRQNH